MKKLCILFLSSLFLVFSSCKKDDENSPGTGDPSDVKNVNFMAYYKPDTEKVLGEDKLVALLSVNDGELTYSAFLNAYPESGMLENCDINNNTMVLGLDAGDFENNGAYMSLNDESAYYLPLVEASSGDYSYFQPTTGDVSDNGFIIYSAATNDASYGDQYTPYLMRFNPAENTYKVAISPTSFVMGQPEQGTDTEQGVISRTIFASPDGKYAYGSVDAMGTEGGSIHWDYSLLYKYDFDLQQYTRLGDTDDNDVTIKAMTSDRRYILYSNHSDTKLLDLETGNTTYTEMNTINVKKNAWGPNGACVGTSNGDLYYKDFVNNTEYVVCSSTGYGWVYNTMFSKNYDYIYFLIEGSTSNYLCVTNGITEGSTYDTIGAIPFEFEDMILVK